MKTTPKLAELMSAYFRAMQAYEHHHLCGDIAAIY